MQLVATTNEKCLRKVTGAHKIHGCMTKEATVIIISCHLHDNSKHQDHRSVYGIEAARSKRIHESLPCSPQHPLNEKYN